MILACHNLNKSFGERVIVRDGSFHIEEREKAAFVGVNGAGKSTVLKMIIGEEPLDGGNVILTRGKQLGYLAQQQNLDGKVRHHFAGTADPFHRAGIEITER